MLDDTVDCMAENIIAYLCDIFYDDDLDTVTIGLAKIFAQICCFGLRADCAANGKAGVEQLFHDPCCEVSVGPCNEDFARGDCGHGEQTILNDLWEMCRSR